MMLATVVYASNPFDPADRTVKQIKRRRRIDKLAPKTKLPFIAILNGAPLLRANKGWHKSLKDGDILTFVTRPQGGGGGSNPLRVVLMIGLSLAAPGIGTALASSLGATTVFGMSAASLLGGAVSLLGSMVINALVPASTPPQVRQQNISAASPTYSLTAQGNSARLLEPIPVQYGRHIAYPDFVAAPYTEYAGNEQYLYQLFCIGQGEYDIEQIRVEDTPITSFAEVTTEIVPPNTRVTLFPTNVSTVGEVNGQELFASSYIGPFVAVGAGLRANYLGFDIVLPKGLFFANDEGGLNAMTVVYRFEARLINDTGAALGGWVVLGTETTTAATNTPQRKSYRYQVAEGRYEVRATRVDAKNTSSRAGHDVMWASARAYLPGVQNYGNVTLLAVRMRATNSLSQQASRRVNVIATRRLPIWQGSVNNLIRYSNSETVGWIIGGNIRRVGNTVSPMGTFDATVYTSRTTTGNAYTAQQNNLKANTTYTMSGWFRLVLGSVPTNGFMLGTNLDIDGNTGTVEGQVIGWSGLTTEWKRFSMTFNNVSAVSGYGSYWLADWSNGAHIAVWGCQLVEGSEPLDYTPSIQNFVSRASNATSKDSFGRLTVQTVNQPRYRINSANLLTTPHPNAFDTWFSNGVTVQPNVEFNPAGFLSADKIVETTATSDHWVANLTTIGAGDKLTYSILAKAAERRFILLAAGRSSVGTPRYQATFDLARGVVVSSNAGGSISTFTPTITKQGNGWYKLSIGGVIDNTSTDYIVVAYVLKTESEFVYQGDGVSGLYLSRAILNEGTLPETFPDGGQPLMLEPASQNLLVYSTPVPAAQNVNPGWFVNSTATLTYALTADNPTGGITNEYVATVATTTVNAGVYVGLLTPSWALNTWYTASCFWKNNGGDNRVRIYLFLGTTVQRAYDAEIDFSTTPPTVTDRSAGLLVDFVVNTEYYWQGWWRISLSGNTGNGALPVGQMGMLLIKSETSTLGMNARITMAQIEARDGVTSYIPTNGTQAIREADVSTSVPSPSGWAAPAATRNPAWALADIFMADYGAKQQVSRIDLNGLKELADIYTARGDTFDARFDQHTTIFEAVTTVGEVARTKPYQQGGVWHFWRDQPQVLPVAMFNMRNIVKSSVKTQYLSPTDDTADAISIEYFDQNTWQWDTVDCQLPDSSGTQFAKIRMFGVTNRAQAYREGMYKCAANRYRRNLVSLNTEMEGFIPTYGDLVAVQHDRPRWGQFGELVAKPHPNLVSFSNYSPQWTAIFDTPTITAGIDDPFGGFDAVRVAKTSATTLVFRNDNFGSGGIIPLQAGKTYTLSFYCRAIVMPSNVTADVSDGTSGAPFGAYQSQLALNAWRRVSFTSVMSANFNATFVDLISNTTNTMTLDFYGVMVNEGNTALPFHPTLALSRTIYTTEPLDFSAGGNHYFRFKRRNGSTSAPILATPGTNEYEAVLATAPDFTPYTGIDEERTTYNFGPADQMDKLCLVRSIKPRSLDRVELSLVMEDDAVHTADTGTPTPSRNWNLISRITSPNIAELDVTLGGTSRTPMINVSWLAASGADTYQVEYSYDGQLSWIRAADTTATQAAFPAQRGVVSVRVRAIGLAAGPYITFTGNPFAQPPADVISFFVSQQPDGTRQFDAAMPGGTPPDFAGYKIRFRAGTWANWDDLNPLHQGLISAMPYETNQISAGTYTFAIKAVDDSGIESQNARFINGALGDPRLAGVIFQSLPHNRGWNGTKTNCFVEVDTGILSANDTTTWDTIGTFDSWTQWNKAPVGSIVYEDNVIDLNGIITFNPLVYVVAEGTTLIEESHSTNGSTYSAWAAVGPTITARYLRVRITVSGAFPRVTSMNVLLNGNAKSETINDLNTALITGVRRIGVGDVRLPLSNTYSSISQVQVALQNVGAGWSWELIDKSTVNGPRIRIYNSSNALADAVIDVSIRGF